MTQTAVEWLLDNLISEPYSEADFKHNKNCWEKAEEMEKQQIINAYDLGSLSEMQYPNPETIIENGEQYYNETFKTE